ncbi:MAG: DoxX family membrane protein [Desulfomonile tiedjei]|nr:DoxX family membrane protein [Desulfomonile tiedjei]
MKYLTFAARLFIGGLFVYASIHKITDPAQFAVSIRNYMILPPEWSHLVALALPWVEIGAGAFLILGIQTKPSALLTTGMLAVFLVAIARAYATGLDIDCGCFSSAAASHGRVDIYHLVRDSLILLVSLFVLLADRGDFCISGLFSLRGRPV